VEATAAGPLVFHRSAPFGHEGDTFQRMSRRCARPGCGQPADTTLSFAYDQRQVWLDDLWADDSPANHDLCARHADRTQPPRGWELRDRRTGVAGAAASSAAAHVQLVDDGLRYAS